MGVTQLQEKEAIRTKQTTSLPLPSPQTWLVAGALGVAGILSVVSYYYAGFVQGSFLVIVIFLGFRLFPARFGFASAFRHFLAVGDGQAIRAHMVLLATATTLLAIIFAARFSLFGMTPGGSVWPVGTSLIGGSFIF